MAKKKLEQQDGSSKTPQNRRDDIIDKLLRGELNPQQAENQAQGRGLDGWPQTPIPQSSTRWRKPFGPPLWRLRGLHRKT